MSNYVTHLECSLSGERLPANEVHGLSAAGKPLLVRYDLSEIRRDMQRTDFRDRVGGFWRYRELLPVRRQNNVVSLGEVTTPLVSLRTEKPGELLVKNEAVLPTGSFKARGLALAVSMAKELGLKHLAMPTNGNAGSALAAYASRAGIRSTIFCPADTPEINVREMTMQGATVWRVDGLITDCGRLVSEGAEREGWFDLSTLKEPYRIEGKKTMGLELAEQLDWQFPDAIFYPTGGGTGLIGMWKAFAELADLGWIEGKKPRMFAVQAEGCAPIVRAFNRNEEHAEPWANATTLAAGIRVPAAIGDFLILRAIRESGGAALAVSDDAIVAAQRHVAASEGLLLCPETAATYAAWQHARTQGMIDDSEQVVLFNCATGLKYPMADNSRRYDARASERR